MENKPNILVPIAGRGQRFIDAGYTIPKQLINLPDGQQLIDVSLNCVESAGCNLIFIIRDDHIYNYNFDEILREKFGEDIQVVVTDGFTEGSVCSCLLARDYIDNSAPLIINTLDVEFSPKFSLFNYITSEMDGFILTFKSNSPAHSYVSLNNMGYATKTAEKKVISENACVGIYYFKEGATFCKYADEMISQNIRVNNEFYIAPMYNLLINDGLKIGSKSVDKLHVFGAPKEYDFYRFNVLKKFGEKPVALCADHSGYDAKEMMKKVLDWHKIKYIDFGTYVRRDCDYKDYIKQAVLAVQDKTCDFAFSFCRTGQGVNICANKFEGIRSALVYNEFAAEMAIRHNCANFFALPGILYENDRSSLERIINICTKHTFDGGRHQNRIQKLED